jgi:hypothetical protein
MINSNEMIGIWQCPKCKRVLQHSFSIYITYSLEGSLWCPCYDLNPPQGCVERRTVTKMAPLNEFATQYEESIRAMRERQIVEAQAAMESRRRAQDYLDSWPA